MYVQGNLQGNMANVNGNGYVHVVRSCSYIAMHAEPREKDLGSTSVICMWFAFP